MVFGGMLDHGHQSEQMLDWLVALHGFSNEDERRALGNERTLFKWWKDARSGWNRQAEPSVWTGPTSAPVCASVPKGDTGVEFGAAFARLMTPEGARPVKAKASRLEAGALPVARGPAEQAARTKLEKALVLAAGMEALRLGSEVREKAKLVAAKKAQQAFDGVCAPGEPGPWCLAAEYEKARVVESLGDAWLEARCGRTPKAASCDSELYSNLRKARRHWEVAQRVYRRLDGLCLSAREAFPCPRIREGLHRLEQLEDQE